MYNPGSHVLDVGAALACCQVSHVCLYMCMHIFMYNPGSHVLDVGAGIGLLSSED